MEMERFCNEAETDHQQKTKAKHHDRRVSVDKFGQEFAGGNHYSHRDDHRTHRHDDMVNHRHRSNDRINGKYGIQYQDLYDHTPKRRMFFLAVGNGKTVMPFKAFMQFGCGFVQKENATGKHNHVLAGNRKAADLE